MKYLHYSNLRLLSLVVEFKILFTILHFIADEDVEEELLGEEEEEDA